MYSVKEVCLTNVIILIIGILLNFFSQWRLDTYIIGVILGNIYIYLKFSL